MSVNFSQLGASPFILKDPNRRSLKYQRLGSASSEILIKDTASALAVSSRFIVSHSQGDAREAP